MTWVRTFRDSPHDSIEPLFSTSCWESVTVGCMYRQVILQNYQFHDSSSETSGPSKSHGDIYCVPPCSLCPLCSPLSTLFTPLFLAGSLLVIRTNLIHRDGFDPYQSYLNMSYVNVQRSVWTLIQVLSDLIFRGRWVGLTMDDLGVHIEHKIPLVQSQRSLYAHIKHLPGGIIWPTRYTCDSLYALKRSRLLDLKSIQGHTISLGWIPHYASF